MLICQLIQCVSSFIGLRRVGTAAARRRRRAAAVTLLATAARSASTKTGKRITRSAAAAAGSEERRLENGRRTPSHVPAAPPTTVGLPARELSSWSRRHRNWSPPATMSSQTRAQLLPLAKSLRRKPPVPTHIRARNRPSVKHRAIPTDVLLIAVNI